VTAELTAGDALTQTCRDASPANAAIRHRRQLVSLVLEDVPGEQ